jgi:hypothetical protein
MASNTQDDVGNDENGKSTSKTAVWIDPEVKALLVGLADKKSTHMSGDGFKPQVWPSIVTKVEQVNPDANPKKDKQKCMNKLNYVRCNQFRDARLSLTSQAAQEDI